jgi:hypothetical protein
MQAGKIVNRSAWRFRLTGTIHLVKGFEHLAAERLMAYGEFRRLGSGPLSPMAAIEAGKESISRQAAAV